MGHRGPQVLADGDDVAAHRGQVGEAPVDLVVGLAQADHDRRFGSQADRTGPGQDRQAAGVPGRGSDPALQTGHRFDVVVQHVRSGIEDRPKSLRVTLAVGDEHFHCGGRVGGSNRGDRRRECRRPAVGQVVAGHRGDHRVGEPHLGYRGGHPVRFVSV